MDFRYVNVTLQAVVNNEYNDYGCKDVNLSNALDYLASLATILTDFDSYLGEILLLNTYLEHFRYYFCNRQQNYTGYFRE